MVFSTQSVTLWASEIPQEEDTILSDDSTADEELAEGALEADGQEDISEQPDEYSEEEQSDEYTDGEDFGVLSEDEGAVEELVGADSLSLDGLTISMEANPKPGQQTNGIARDASVSVAMRYKIDDTKLSTAQGCPVWTYDLNTMVDSGILKSVTGVGGDIMQGGGIRGAYSIDNNIVTLVITDLDWLRKQKENVRGTFDFEMNLDADKIGEQGSYDFNFPGGATLPVTFEDKVLNDYKGVGSNEHYQGEINDGRDLTVTSDDGGYRLYYATGVKPNASLSTLKVTDQLTGSQKLDSSTVMLNGAPVSEQYVSTADDSFTVDVAAYLSSIGSSVSANSEYKITYQTTIAEENLGELQSNTASWEWAGGTNTDSTSVTPIKPETVINYDKDVDKVSSVEGNGAGAVINYTVTINPNHINIAGFTITDVMTDIQNIVGDINVTPAINGSTTISADTATFNDETYSHDKKQVFTYTFPTDGEYTDTYTITYKTQIPEKTGSISGNTWLANEIELKDPEGNTGKKDTSNPFLLPGDKDVLQSPKKQLTSWQPQNDTAIFTITLGVKDGENVKNVELISKGTSFGNDPNNYNLNGEILWDEITVIDKDNNSVDFTPDREGKSISFESLTKSVTITVPVKSPVSIVDQDDYYAKNSVDINIDGQYFTNIEDSGKYKPDGVVSRKTVSYDKDKAEWSWTVTVNPTNKIIEDGDFVPYFKDILPEGMQIVGDIAIKCNGNGNLNANGQQIWERSGSATPATTTGTIGPIDLTEAVYDQYNASPTGISGMRYEITYTTKLTDEEIAAVTGSEETKTYTNIAQILDDNENIKSQVERPTTYTYEFIKKYDTAPEKLAKDVITYSVIINPDALELNGGANITVTDTLDTAVELVTNSITVKGKDGNKLSSARVGYLDDTRTIEITLPDSTYAQVDFSVTAAELNDLRNENDKTEYSNTVFMKGASEYSASVSKEHRAIDHSASITGETNIIGLHKVDRYDLGEDLENAQFSLY